MTDPLPAGRLVDPTRKLTFIFDGRIIPALHCQSIGAALYAAGVRTFSRSFKYHRPRGLFCVAGDCPNCLMQVDGRPNVRTCIEPVRQGQVVRGQNCWPSLNFDVLRVFDKLDRFLPVGFYYKRFHKPRWLWPIFEHAVRHIAGLGRIDVHGKPELDVEVEYLHAEICVVGGGAAGLAAANAAAEAGADVLLIERMPMLGGRLLYDGVAQPLPDIARCRTLLDTTVFGLYEGNLLGAFHANRLLKIRAKQIIVCTGSRQPPVPFPNNDLPGIMPLSGVLRLAKLYGVRAGTRVFIMGDQRDTEIVMKHLDDIGITFVASCPYPVNLPETVRAIGGTHLRTVQTSREFPCDLLCLATEPVPANELLLQGGVRYKYESGRWQVAQGVPGLTAAGGAAGFVDVEAQIADGRLQGRDAAERLGHAVPAMVGLPYPGCAFEAGPGTPEAIRRGRGMEFDSPRGKRFVCLCEDVTVKDIDQAVAEGFDNIETLKRYATVGMGPCQGKMCSQTAMALCARATGQELGAVGMTTSRPPAVPVELAVLAAERRHHPVRRTPMHHWHQANGARWIDAGQWKRPESYGDPTAEVRAVRSGVGLIDVSTLGKIEVSGLDAAVLLDRVYLNEWANLAIGKARYGVMCTEEGIVFDDGVGIRLEPERFFLTTTTGNAEAVFQWLELWRTTWRLKATVRHRTPELAAMNLAGPRSRDVLGRLTSLDLSASAFPHLSFREGEVAGVGSRIMRLGFVGELGYEIHCPSRHGQYLWEQLFAAGAEAGIKPFGVEAQRILRLEKGHLIVGQDTDALSDPFGAGLDRMVRFDKPQFHGRAALLRRKDLGVPARLVGFQLPDGDQPKADNVWARQLEGCQVVDNGRPTGRVTSVRFSPTLGKYVGLAWMPAVRAAVGNTFSFRAEERDRTAEIVPTPFFDPKGERLKSDGSPSSRPLPMARPVARTPLHQWHATHGARFVDREGWQTVSTYTDSSGEAKAAQTGLGLADISALGNESMSACATLLAAGPRLEGLLRRVMQIDVRAESLPIGMRVQTMLARVEATLERLDACNVPAVRIQVAWDLGEYVWERLIEAGHDMPVTPMGLDAVRLLDRR